MGGPSVPLIHPNLTSLLMSWPTQIICFHYMFQEKLVFTNGASKQQAPKKQGFIPHHDQSSRWSSENPILRNGLMSPHVLLTLNGCLASNITHV